MSINSICHILRRLNISSKGIGSLSYSTSCISQKSPQNFGNSILPSLQVTSHTFTPNFGLSPLRTSLDLDLPKNNPWIHPIIIEKPFQLPNTIIESPKSGITPISENIPEKSIELPTNLTIEKQAARLIVIRRRKMRRHKLKKLRKKMKFVWRKRKQRRELLKERAFQGELIAQVKEAEAFDAKSYVASRLQILDHKRLPSKWRGEVLPESMIKQFIKEKEERRLRKASRPRLTLD